MAHIFTPINQLKLTNVYVSKRAALGETTARLTIQGGGTIEKGWKTV